jgi:hypothetical protein
LTWVAIARTDFSPEVISAPLIADRIAAPSPEIEAILAQPYLYLGQGRQSFVFVSEDGQSILKLFNRRYIEIPWYTSSSQEKIKRDRRKHFFLESYPLAEKYLKEETGILYVHLGQTDRPLGKISLIDKASRLFSIDLNEVPFVLQRKGVPFYPALSEENLPFSIEAFLNIIAKRIAYGIADADHDVEHNFGLLDGKPFHLDPGRFSLCENFNETERSRQEWWSATHRFRDWLEEKYPAFISFFDAKRSAAQTNSMRAQPPLPTSPALQTDGSPLE